METGKDSSLLSPPNSTASDGAGANGSLEAIPPNTAADPPPQTVQRLSIPRNSKSGEALPVLAVPEVNSGSTELKENEKARGDNADDKLKSSERAKTIALEDVDGVTPGKFKSEETLQADKGVRFEGSGQGENHSHHRSPSQEGLSIGPKKKNKKRKPKSQRGLVLVQVHHVPLMLTLIPRMPPPGSRSTMLMLL